MPTYLFKSIHAVVFCGWSQDSPWSARHQVRREGPFKLLNTDVNAADSVGSEGTVFWDYRFSQDTVEKWMGIDRCGG